MAQPFQFFPLVFTHAPMLTRGSDKFHPCDSMEAP